MRPFEDIRVLDLTHVLAGPFSTFQLAALGADVIKIEAPDRPDMTRTEGISTELNDALYGTYFLGQNGGKRSLTLDISTPEGARILRRLIGTADVLVQNYSGSSLEDLGFGPEDALALNPRLIYCSMTGFGRTGPKRDDPAYDIVIQAFSGIMASNGYEGQDPVRVGPPMVDYGTGAQAALAISAALYQRDRTGKGQVIDVSMLDSAFMLMASNVTDTLTTGTAAPAHGNAHPYYSGYATYPTLDGSIMIGAFTTEQMAKLMEALGEDGRAAELRRTPRVEIRHVRASDAALITERLATAPASDWEARLNAADVPAARVRTIDEAVEEAQTRARDGLQDQPALAEAGGPARLPVAGFAYAHGSPRLNGPPPRFGEHVDEILSDLGLSTGEIDELRQKHVI